MVKNYFRETLVSTLFVIISGSLSAQIVYKDIPDVVVSEPTQYTPIHNVDFDSNFQNDLSLEWSFAPPAGFVPKTNTLWNKVNATTTNPIPMAANAAIDNTLTYKAFSPITAPMTNFLDQGDKYIGCEFRKLNVTYYAWILVNYSTVNNVKTFTVKSYAYNTVGNQPILAGQTTVLGVDDISGNEKTVGVYPNPVENTLYLKENNKGTAGEISSFSILNSTGQLIKKTDKNGKDGIDVSDLPNGVYYLQLKDKEGLKPQNIKFIKK